MADFLLTSDPKSITPAQYRRILRDFIEERLFAELESLVLRYSGPSEHLSFEVSCNDLLDFDPSLGFNVIHFPKLLLPIFDEAIFEAQTNLCAHPALEVKNGRKGSVKKYCHIRIISLPPTEYLNKPTISDIRADDVDSLIQVSGKVVRTGAVRMLEVSKKYECQNPRCQYRFTILADPEQDNMLPQPRSCPCPSNDAAGGNGKKCTSTNLRELEGYRVCVDYQELKIQDSFERVSLGSIPRSIIVILEADLVDKFNAGDDVVVVGVLVRQWKPVYKKSRCSVEIALRANSMLALNAQDRLRVVTSDTVSQFESFWQPYKATDRLLEGRDIIIRSICPQLYGLFFVKLALLLTLVGGSSTQSDRGVKRRSQSHLLVVGDPGCGKSQILRFAASVVARSVLTTGIGTSGAGLTCTAVRDGSDWSLEAGALVLANDGVCCIDEFASIKDQDRVTIHEAMEQQSISVAKAGLVVKLNTRATVLACCNPKGTYDVTADISTNTAIASPLLSRFDLVLVLLDSPQKEWDKRVSTFLLQQAVNAGTNREKKKSVGQSRQSVTGRVEEEATWELLKLRDYIAYVKHTFQPSLSKEAELLLMRYYQMQRQSEDRSQGRTTVRLLESLMRLSEAHAKVMSRHTVLLEDAVVAVACVHLSQEQTSLLDSNSTLHSDFPPDPMEFYSQQESKVLALLHCTKLSLLRDANKGDQGGGAGSRDGKAGREVEEVEVFEANVAAALSDQPDRNGVDGFRGEGTGETGKGGREEGGTETRSEGMGKGFDEWGVGGGGKLHAARHPDTESDRCGVMEGDASSSFSGGGREGREGRADSQGDQGREMRQKRSMWVTNPDGAVDCARDDSPSAPMRPSQKSVQPGENSWGSYAHEDCAIPPSIPQSHPKATLIEGPWGSTGGGGVWRGDTGVRAQQTSHSQPPPSKVGSLSQSQGLVPRASAPHSQQQLPPQQQQARRDPLKSPAVSVTRPSPDMARTAFQRTLPQLPPGLHRAPFSSSIHLGGVMPSHSSSSSSPAPRKRFRATSPGNGDGGGDVSSSVGDDTSSSNTTKSNSSRHGNREGICSSIELEGTPHLPGVRRAHAPYNNHLPSTQPAVTIRSHGITVEPPTASKGQCDSSLWGGDHLLGRPLTGSVPGPLPPPVPVPTKGKCEHPVSVSGTQYPMEFEEEEW